MLPASMLTDLPQPLQVQCQEKHLTDSFLQYLTRA